MEILIPTIEKYKAFKLTEKTSLEEFRYFLRENGGEVHSFSKDGVITHIQFDWNPNKCDYAEHYQLNMGETFMYNVDNPEISAFAKQYESHWIILN